MALATSVDVAAEYASLCFKMEELMRKQNEHHCELMQKQAEQHRELMQRQEYHHRKQTQQQHANHQEQMQGQAYIMSLIETLQRATGAVYQSKPSDLGYCSQSVTPERNTSHASLGKERTEAVVDCASPESSSSTSTQLHEQVVSATTPSQSAHEEKFSRIEESTQEEVPAQQTSVAPTGTPSRQAAEEPSTVTIHETETPSTSCTANPLQPAAKTQSSATVNEERASTSLDSSRKVAVDGTTGASDEPYLPNSAQQGPDSVTSEMRHSYRTQLLDRMKHHNEQVRQNQNFQEQLFDDVSLYDAHLLIEDSIFEDLKSDTAGYTAHMNRQINYLATIDMVQWIQVVYEQLLSLLNGPPIPQSVRESYTSAFGSHIERFVNKARDKNKMETWMRETNLARNLANAIEQMVFNNNREGLSGYQSRADQELNLFAESTLKGFVKYVRENLPQYTDNACVLDEPTPENDQIAPEGSCEESGDRKRNKKQSSNERLNVEGIYRPDDDSMQGIAEIPTIPSLFTSASQPTALPIAPETVVNGTCDHSGNSMDFTMGGAIDEPNDAPIHAPMMPSPNTMPASPFGKPTFVPIQPFFVNSSIPATTTTFIVADVELSDVQDADTEAPKNADDVEMECETVSFDSSLIQQPFGYEIPTSVANTSSSIWPQVPVVPLSKPAVASSFSAPNNMSGGAEHANRGETKTIDDVEMKDEVEKIGSLSAPNAVAPTLNPVHRSSPVVSPPKPVIPLPSFVVSPPSPVISPLSPVVSTPSPVVSLKSPVRSSSEPIGPPTKPVDRPSKPIDPPLKPIDTPAKPVNLPLKPINSSLKPVDPPLKPFDPPSKPIDPPSNPVVPPANPVVVPSPNPTTLSSPTVPSNELSQAERTKLRAPMKRLGNLRIDRNVRSDTIEKLYEIIKTMNLRAIERKAPHLTEHQLSQVAKRIEQEVAGATDEGRKAAEKTGFPWVEKKHKMQYTRNRDSRIERIQDPTEFEKEVNKFRV